VLFRSPEEMLEEIFNLTAVGVERGNYTWGSPECPIKCFEDFAGDPRTIECLAKDKPIIVTHSVILRVKFVPIGASVGPMRAIRMKVLPRGASSFPGIILAAIVFFLPDYKSVKQEGEAMLSKQFFKGWGEVFKIPSYWLVMLTAAFAYFMVIPLSVWTPTLLIRAYNMDIGSSGIAFGLIQLVVLLGPLGAILMDRWHKNYKNARPLGLAIVTLLITALGLVQMQTVGIPLAIWLICPALTVLCFAIFMPLMLSSYQDVVPVGLRATAGGVFNFVGQITGASIGPILVGAISDASGGGAHGIQVGIMWMAPIAFLGVVTSLLLLKFYPSDSAKVKDEVLAEK
jgi:hypothetical protein